MFLDHSLLYGIIGFFAFFVSFNFTKPVNAGVKLNDFIVHYEPLFYDHRHLKDQHHRATRSAMDDFVFHFTAHKRLFRLRLKRDDFVFAPDIEFESTGRTVRYDITRAVSGYVEGEDDSSAEGVLTESGLFNGVVRVGDEEFYIEPAEKYLPPPHQFHSVMYKLSDVRFPQRNVTCLSDRIRHPSRHSSSAEKFRKEDQMRPDSTCVHRDGNRNRKNSKLSRKKTGDKQHDQKSDGVEDPSLHRTYKDMDTRLKNAEMAKLHKGRTTIKSHVRVPATTFIPSCRRENEDLGTTKRLRCRILAGKRAKMRKSDKITNLSLTKDKVLLPEFEATINTNLNRTGKLKVADNPLRERTNDETTASFLSETKSTKIDAHLLKQLHPINPMETEQDGELAIAETHHLEIKGDKSDFPSKSALDFKNFKVKNNPNSKNKSSIGEVFSFLYSHEDGREQQKFSNGKTFQSLEPNDFVPDSMTTSGVSHNIRHGVSPMDGNASEIDDYSGDRSAWDGYAFNGTDEEPKDDDSVPYWRELDALHYTEDGRTGSSEPYGVRSIQRTQWNEDRGQRHVAVDRRKSTCLLYLQADHLFYQKMGSEEACIEAMTRHVQRVNSIYRTTDFDQDGRPDNISFLIKRIKVHTRPLNPEYRFIGNYGVEKFLELFSEDDYDAFCLAYMFTYRDFEGGTLGLAWTGDLKNAGGVCEKNGHYRGSLKSLNTGIITLLNYGKHVPPVVSHVTLAHEIGHNFGSPHDPEDDQHCTPGGDHGNYIMFARATSGDKKNNNKFSPCSLRSVNAVLNTKARSVKGCFNEPLDAVCGNEVVEGTEECDCGWEEDCHEPCCFPMRVSPPQDQPPCRLRPVAFCSPSQGPCCSHDCRLKYGTICREDNGCRTSSYCDGQGPQCPPSTMKPNKTICSEEFVCYNGECTGSICMAYGLESCQCIRTFHDPLIRSCELCCKIPGDELSCKSSFEWNLAPYDVPDLYAKPGAPCDNYNGYCDVYQACREIDPSGPLATLRKLLLSPEGAAILKQWFAERWLGLLLLFLAVTFTVAILVRLLSRRNAKHFLSTILPGQSDFRLCHSRSSPRSRQSGLVSSFSGTSNGLVKSSLGSRPRVSSAPENGWV